jgi:hypothetical protein
MNKILLFAALLFSSATFASQLEADLHTYVSNLIANIGIPANAQTTHHALVNNTTDVGMDVMVYYKICADNNGCDDSHHYKIHINPHSIWQDGLNLHLYPIYNRVGRFIVTGSTIVTGNGLENGRVENVSTGYIDVR